MNSRMSSLNFDPDQPTSFVNEAGSLLSQLQRQPATASADDSPNSTNSGSNPDNYPPPARSKPSDFVPPIPQAPPSMSTFTSSIPQIPLPMAPNAATELVNIPHPIAPQVLFIVSTKEKPQFR